jgi:hypothetical protein
VEHINFFGTPFDYYDVDDDCFVYVSWIDFYVILIYDHEWWRNVWMNCCGDGGCEVYRLSVHFQNHALDFLSVHRPPAPPVALPLPLPLHHPYFPLPLPLALDLPLPVALPLALPLPLP